MGETFRYVLRHQQEFCETFPTIFTDFPNKHRKQAFDRQNPPESGKQISKIHCESQEGEEPNPFHQASRNPLVRSRMPALGKKEKRNQERGHRLLNRFRHTIQQTNDFHGIRHNHLPGTITLKPSSECSLATCEIVDFGIKGSLMIKKSEEII